MEKLSLKVVDNEVLRGFSWTIDDAVANVVIFEGMEEHVSRYDDFAKYLNSKKLNVFAIDTYGQGENVAADFSNIGVWPKEGFAKQVIANDLLVQKCNENGLKTYIFAHSMGSFMAQDYIQRFPGHVEKVVLCGSGSKNPALGLGYTMGKLLINDKNSLQKATLFNKLMFGNFNNKIKNPRTPYDWLSVNEDNVNKYIEDPLCGFSPNNSFCFEFMKGMMRIFKKNSLSRINKNQKLFIITGKDDPVTNYSKSVKALTKMYNKFGVKNITSKIYDNMRHEILNETNKEIVFKDVADFFLK